MSAYVDKLVSSRQQVKIKNTLNAFETGSATGDYANVSIYNDGKNGTYQITYGKRQTTEQGNLKTLLQMYVNNHGTLAGKISPYLSKIGVVSLYQDKTFIGLLKKAGSDPVMQTTQDVFFDQVYYTPACGWFQANQFILPLSLLVIYDSYIQSGSILMLLRKKFAELTPAYKGDEKKWVTSYVTVRNAWLLDSSNIDLQHSAYRTKCLLEQIQLGNWNLEASYVANDVTIV